MKTVNGKERSGLLVKVLVLFFLLLLTVIFLAVMIPAWIVTDRLINPPLNPVSTTPADVGLSFEDIRYRSMDGRLKEGWLVPCSRNRPLWLILVPPFRSGKTLWPDNEGLSLIKRLNDHRYSVLVMDSDRFPDSRDIRGAVRYLKIRDPAAEIGVIGWGEGASAAICAASGFDSILFVVADSPYADLKNFLENRLPYWSGLPRNPWTPAALFLFAARSGIRYRKSSPFEALRLMDKPVLILLAEGNPVIANSEGFLLEEVSATAELKLLPLADHTRGYPEYPETWMLEVIGFLHKLNFN